MRIKALLSRSALAVVLGAVALSATPAMARDKDKKKEAAAAPAVPAISPSKGYFPEAKKVQAALIAKDAVALETALTAADAVATTPQDKYLQHQFRLQLGLLKSDQTIQSAALDGMIDSGLTPATDIARFNFFSGQFAYNQKNYPKVITRLQAAKAAGATERDLPLLLMDSYLRTNQLDQELGVAKDAITTQRAAGQTPSDEFYVRMARDLQKANRREDLLDLLAMRVHDHPLPEIWRNTLFIHMQGADKDLTLDTLRLMRNIGAMKERAEVQEFAALSTEGGLPGEVLAVIDEARAKKIIPETDARFKEIYDAQKARTVGDKAALDADAAKGAALPTPRRARSSADALFGYGDYAKAAALYQIALDKGDTEVDLTTMRLGVAQFLSGNSEAAKATLAKVGGARKRLAGLWLTHIAAKTAAPTATTS
jgi:tetratricopeptide (TPR) repeat protein